MIPLMMSPIVHRELRDAVVRMEEAVKASCQNCIWNQHQKCSRKPFGRALQLLMGSTVCQYHPALRVSEMSRDIQWHKSMGLDKP